MIDTPHQLEPIGPAATTLKWFASTVVSMGSRTGGTLEEYHHFVDEVVRDYRFPFPLHLYTAKTLKSLLAQAFGDTGRGPSQALAKYAYDALHERYAVTIAAAITPPGTIDEMVDYLDSQQILSDLGLDRETARVQLKAIDVSAHHVPPKRRFTEYYPDLEPPTDVRFPASYGPMEGVILSWPLYYPYRWAPHADFARAIAMLESSNSPNASVHILVPNTMWQRAVQLCLQTRGVPLDMVKFQRVSADDVWSRDFGPTVLRTDQVAGGLALVANHYFQSYSPYQKRSEEVPMGLGRCFDAPVYRLPLVVEGGNMISDGGGTIVTLDSVLDHNADVPSEHLQSIFQRYFGCKRTIHLKSQPEDMVGHIDMYVKFINEETILVAESRDRRLNEYLGKEIRAPLERAFGRARFVSISMADVPAEGMNMAWSYVNSLTVNDSVIVPQFRFHRPGTDDLLNEDNDKHALEVYRKLYPDKEVIGINFSDFPLGSAHCQSREIPRVP